MQYILTEHEKKDYDEFLALKETPIAYTSHVHFMGAKHFEVHWWGEKEATAFLQHENKELINKIEELYKVNRELTMKLEVEKAQRNIDARNNRSWLQKLFKP